MGRGVSIHIGLNTLDENHYKIMGRRLFEPLQGCVSDAKIMQRIAGDSGFETTELFTDVDTPLPQLKANHILDRIRFHAGQLGKGDFFLLTFAGHGSQITNFGPDPELLDQTWCMYDRMVIDDELTHLWSLFDPGVKLLFISDSCHSGTMHFIPEMETMLSGEVESSLAIAKSRTVEQIPFEEFDLNIDMSAIRRLRGRIHNDLIDARPAIYEPVFEGLFDNLGNAGSFNEKVRAGLIAISACQDGENAKDGADNGIFTGTLKKVWFGTATPASGQTGGFPGSYLEFFEEVEAATTAANNDQHPRFFPFLIDEELEDFPLIDKISVEAFVNSSPFRI